MQMTRKFKALGLAFVAVFAMSAIVASAAQATTHKMDTPGLATAKIKAVSEGEQTLATSTASVKCKSAEFNGTVSGETNITEITVSPTYSECKLGSETATVTTTGCNYVLKGVTSAGGDATAAVSCSGGSEIEIKTSLCTLLIGTQTPAGGVHYTGTTGESGKEEVTIAATVSGIVYEKEGGLGCLFAGNGHDASYTGNTTAAAYEDVANGAKGNLKMTTE